MTARIRGRPADGRMRRAGAAASLLLLLLGGAPSGVSGAPAGGGEGIAACALDVRSPGRPGSGGGERGYRSRLLPDGGPFRPLLADMKEPRFYGGVRSVDFEGPALPGGGQETIKAGVTAFGGSFGIWGLRRVGSCEGVQVGLFAGVFSQFNLDLSSADLINTDFTVGPQVTARRGRWSARVRAFHQSSHLGDEFLISNPEVDRENLSFEAIDVLLSLAARVGSVEGRLYGGGGTIVSSASGLDPGLAQWGLEARGPGLSSVGGTAVRPVVGADFRSFEEHDWRTTASVKGGLEWSGSEDGPALRLLAVYLNGFMPFGQFFSTTQLSNVGGELQLRF